MHACGRLDIPRSPLDLRLDGRPSAVRLGLGGVGGHCVSFSPTSAAAQPVPERYLSKDAIEYGQIPAGFEELTTEEWSSDGTMRRRTVRLLPEDGCAIENLSAETSRATLPPACNGATVLRPALEPDAPIALGTAWALDATSDDGGLWQLETVVDGLYGERPRERRGSVEAGAERTRIACSFDPTTGTLAAAAPVRVWQERCWSAAPSETLVVQEGAGSRSGLDGAWVSSVVGLACFGEQRRAEPAAGAAAAGGGDGGEAGAAAATLSLSVGGGVELRGGVGRLEVTLTAGAGARTPWRRGGAPPQLDGRLSVG